MRSRLFYHPFILCLNMFRCLDFDFAAKSKCTAKENMIYCHIHLKFERGHVV